MPCIKPGLEYIQTGKDGSGFVIGMPKSALVVGWDIDAYMSEAKELLYKPVMEDGLIPITVADIATNCLMTFCSEEGDLPSDDDMNKARDELYKRIFAWVEVPDFTALMKSAEMLQDRNMQFYEWHDKYYIRGAGNDCMATGEFGDSIELLDQYYLEDSISAMTDFTQKLKNFIEYEKR